MKKIVTMNLCLYMLIGMVIAVGAIYAFQTIATHKDNMQSSRDKLAVVKEKLESNDSEIARLTENLGENNLAKTRAFADIIAENPDIIEDQEKMEELKEELMVSELHVINGKGIITHSTVKDYINFDMGSGEQSAQFLEIIDDPSLEIVQEPQENAAEGILMQYVGVARKDAKGFVQVGIRPEILEETLAGCAVDVVLRDIEYEDTGYIYAIDPETGNFLAHQKESLIGTSAVEAGIPAKEGSGRAKIDGTEGYYVSEEYDGMLIGTFLPLKEYYESRKSQMAALSVSLFMIFILLLVLINHMVDKKIVKGLKRIADAMKKVTAGDYSVRLNETGSPEFELLSAGINRMLEGLQNNLQKQQQDMENLQMLVCNVKSACANLDQVSKEILFNARSIHSGTEEQEGAVGDLQTIMDSLAKGLEKSADATTSGSVRIQQTVQTMYEGRQKMKEMEASIQNLSETSVEIEKIIGEIDAIAMQTHMLSINASIEAARAGEFGKGFAVVASQVGELAILSSKAAEETKNLITNAITAIEGGRGITVKTVEVFDGMTEEIEDISDSVKKIADMVDQNVSVVGQALDGLKRISSVVERNVEISQNSEQASVSMANETGSLLKMIEQ